MKKILLFASALAGLFLAGSCQRENLEPVGGNTVTYTVQLSDAVGTKALALGDDITAVNELVYEVWRTKEEGIMEFSKTDDNLLYHKTAEVKNGVATIELEFVNNQNFTVLFWAHTKDNGVYKVDDLTKVTITSPDVANNVNAQAFVGRDFVRNCVSDADGKVTLTRPVSQLNIATTPESLRKFQDVIELKGSSVKVTGLATSYNIATLSAFGATATEYEYTETAVPTDALTVNGVGYTYVAMNYVGFAANDGSSEVTVSYVINTSEGDIKNEIINVPFKPNYRTNIVGNLITSMSDYTITLNKDWADEELAPKAIYLAAALGGEFTLDNNLELEAPVVVPAGVDFVLNLNGKSIKNTTQSEVFGEGEGIIAYGNLTINGEGTVEGSTMAVWARGNDGAKVTINGGTYKGCAEGFAKGGRSVIYASSGNVIDIYGGTFESLSADKTSYANKTDGVYAALNVADNNGMINVYGGTFVKQSPAAPGTEPSAWNTTHPNGFVAEGYKAISVGDNYHVFPEVVADAATTANVTAVTESTANVATALATNNGEATMFMWNDVAYIAKYGEVVITSAADEATTVRGVVEGATGLKKATVAEGIEVVGNRTFRQCKGLETVSLPSSLTEIGPAVFQSCSKLANVTIPASVTTIGEGAFAECTSLTSINIPDGITRLEKEVLRNTGLVSIEIPASVNYIGTFAFRDCESLTEVKILSPEFTIENNTFTNMAAPVPTMTIYVVNAEMKAYLESVLTDYDKSYITVVDPGKATTTAGLMEALANGAKIVNVAEGEYSFPASSVNAGTTIVCEPGTVFTGTSGLNINGSTVIGATFANKDGVAVSGTIYGTFKDCTFVGEEALRWCYSDQGKDIVFENCVIKTDFRGFHFDGMEGNVVFKNCEINGFNAYSGEGTITFEGCTFGNDESTYNGLNIYSNTVLKNCHFYFVSGKTNFIDMEGTGKTLTIENCTATLDGAAAEISNFVGGSQLENNTVVIK